MQPKEAMTSNAELAMPRRAIAVKSNAAAVPEARGFRDEMLQRDDEVGRLRRAMAEVPGVWDVVDYGKWDVSSETPQSGKQPLWQLGFGISERPRWWEFLEKELG